MHPHFHPYKVTPPGMGVVEPVVASSGVNWRLIEITDPGLSKHKKRDRNLAKLAYEFPYYRFTEIDSSIVSHPLAHRLFLLLQKVILGVNEELAEVKEKCKKQQHQMEMMEDQIEEMETTKKPVRHEKCYVCGRRFFKFERLQKHMNIAHPNLKYAWKSIITNNEIDKNVITAERLREEVRKLRQALEDQNDALQETKTGDEGAQKPHDSHGPKMSYVAIEPKHGPFVTNRIIDMGSDGEGIYDDLNADFVIDDMNETVFEANVEKRRTRQAFGALNHAIRIRLESELPEKSRKTERHGQSAGSGRRSAGSCRRSVAQSDRDRSSYHSNGHNPGFELESGNSSGYNQSDQFHV